MMDRAWTESIPIDADSLAKLADCLHKYNSAPFRGREEHTVKLDHIEWEHGKGATLRFVQEGSPFLVTDTDTYQLYGLADFNELC